LFIASKANIDKILYYGGCEHYKMSKDYDDDLKVEITINNLSFGIISPNNNLPKGISFVAKSDQSITKELTYHIKNSDKIEEELDHNIHTTYIQAMTSDGDEVANSNVSVYKKVNGEISSIDDYFYIKDVEVDYNGIKSFKFNISNTVNTEYYNVV